MRKYLKFSEQNWHSAIPFLGQKAWYYLTKKLWDDFETGPGANDQEQIMTQTLERINRMGGARFGCTFASKTLDACMVFFPYIVVLNPEFVEGQDNE